MRVTEELPELIVTSRTQSAETIQKILDEGFNDVHTETVNDQPDPETAEAVAEPAAADPATDQANLSPDGTELESADGQDPEGKEVPVVPHKKLGGFRKKIVNLQSENERLKRELAAKTTTQAAAPLVEKAPEPVKKLEPEAVKPPAAEGKPALENFASYEEFIEALAGWTYRDNRRIEKETERQTREREESERQSTAAREARTAAEAEQAAETERWKTKFDAAVAEHPDFPEVLKRPENNNRPFSGPLTLAVRDSDAGGEVLYYLATHDAELKRINDATMQKAGSSQFEQRRLLSLAYREVENIALKLATEAAEAEAQEFAGLTAEEQQALADAEAGAQAEEVPEDPIHVEPVAAARPVRPIPVVVPAPVYTAKSTPIRPVGSRGTTARRSLKDLNAQQLKALDPDVYRRMYEAEEATR